jgi:hypothetical protein
LQKDSAHDIICGSNGSLGFPISGGCVGTREAIGDAMIGEKSMKVIVDEFTTIIALN